MQPTTKTKDQFGIHHLVILNKKVSNSGQTVGCIKCGTKLDSGGLPLGAIPNPDPLEAKM